MSLRETNAEKAPDVSTEPVSDVESSLPREATEDELQTLPRIVDKIPLAVWAATFVGATERFSYYAVLAIWQNYMQHERGSSAVPGALGLGQSTATSISNGFFVCSFLTPTLFAIVSDMWLGRYNTLILAICLLLCGNIIMFATSLPVSLERGAGIPGLAVAMILIALGIGGIKSNMAPFIADQYPQQKARVVRQKNGELGIVDGSRTIQFIYNSLMWFINIASLSAIPATFLEREVDFWSAYLMAATPLVVCLTVLICLKSRLVKVMPLEGVLPRAIKALSMAAMNGFQLDHAKGAYQLLKTGHAVPWDDSFIEELKTGLMACRVIFCFALFYLCITQVYNNLVSQAGQMNLHGIPNDMIQAMSSVCCIVLGPIVQALYSFLARRRIPFGPMARITVAFLMASGGMAYAAGVQKLIYSSGPCFEAPLACPASNDGHIPNDVNVWMQMPIYVAVSVAEIFGLVTASEFSYEKAPRGMRSVVQAMVQLSACLGALIGIAMSPAARDPYLVAVYASLAGLTALCSAGFWFVFRRYDKGGDGSSTRM